MGNVLDIGEVEEIVVVAQLPTGLARAVDVDQMILRHDVALADNARGPDGGGEELGVVDTVRLENDLFGGGLIGRRSTYS